MSQNDFNLANQGFPSMRSDMNSAFQALATNSSGATAPSTTYAYQWWYDDANDILKFRNSDNDAWIDFVRFDQTNNTWSGVSAGGVSGRNLIINGSGRINQRAYVSGAATSGANQYTLDRWRVVTSGQNLTFTGNDSARTMTAPAGGVEQVIEGASIVGGTYIISFTGTATCTVGGVTKTSGDTFTLAANTNATVRFTGGTFSDVQIELGTIATPFERRAVGTELALCQRYYQTVSFTARYFATVGEDDIRTQSYAVRPRATPALGEISASSGGVFSSASRVDSNGQAVSVTIVHSGSGGSSYSALISVDSEL